MAQFRKDTHRFLNQEKTIFEVVMLADQYGNIIGPANPSGTAVDAFGRARISQPLTLHDSSHRYFDDGKSSYANTSGGTYSFASNTSSIDCVVTTTSGSSVYRETNRVFAYQPGKSLQTLSSFVMNPAKTNLRQRIGYFSSENGFYVERSSLTTSGVCFVERSKATGAVVNTPVDQSQWNIDTLDGTGPSLLTLNLDNPQILFIDIEWLGVGSVRMGFVIDGKFIHCHTFNHANLDTVIKGAYIQTACLPVRSEIENTSTTASSSTLKVVSSSVISEGGYELAGKSKTHGQEPTAESQIQLSSAGTYYPLVSFRLKSTNLDSIVIPKNISVNPINSAHYRWKVIAGATINGAVWTSYGSDSSVEYNSNTSATVTGGTDLNSGYVSITAQTDSTVSLGDGLFKYQLERNSFTSTPTTFTLALTSGTASSNAVGSVTWEEII